MKTVEQIGRGVAHYYDMVVRRSLSGPKGILYGVAVGMAAKNADKLAAQYMPVLQMLGAADADGNINVMAIAEELKCQMAQGDGEIAINVGTDVFKFRPADVDAVINCIEGV